MLMFITHFRNNKFTFTYFVRISPNSLAIYADHFHLQFCSGVVPSLFREGLLCLITNGILNLTLDGVVFIDQNFYVV